MTPQTEFRTRRVIEFSDTDMGGIVHFSRFFVFMETAEHEFLASLGTPVHFDLDGEKVGWPRLAARCEYRSPARYGDALDIHLRVARKGSKSMTYDIDFHCGDRHVARGQVSSICCVLSRPEGLASIRIPSFIADGLADYRREP